MARKPMFGPDGKPMFGPTGKPLLCEPEVPCCDSEEPDPDPLLECSRCLAGTTPYAFQVDLVREYFQEHAAPFAVMVELPAGSYLCTQEHPLSGTVNGCFWYGPIVASFVDSTVVPSACNALGPTRYFFPVAYISGGTLIYQWARSTGATSWTGLNAFAGTQSIPLGYDCGTITDSESVAADTSTTGSYCVDGVHSGENNDGGTISCVAIP
jgi:hypothetical protein